MNLKVRLRIGKRKTVLADVALNILVYIIVFIYYLYLYLVYYWFLLASTKIYNITCI